MATFSEGTNHQTQRDEIMEALAKAHALPVQYSCRVCVDFHPLPEHDPPHHTHTTPLKQGDFIHFKKPYNMDWWIGRVVGHETGMTFVPSEAKLLSVVCEGVEPERVEVYQRAPVMRPLIFLGPSSKDSELTRLLHKPLLNYLREKFSDRLHTVTPSHSVRDMMDKECRQLESEVYIAASTMNLVLLDSDASSHSDLELTKLHPHYIYIKVARQKVLQSLIHQLTKTSSERQLQLTHARQLFENAHRSSVIISDSNVDDACLALELFVESYWAATRSVVLTGRGL